MERDDQRQPHGRVHPDPGSAARHDCEGEGTIVTVSSLAALNPNLLGGAAYGAAKAGVTNFMTFVHNTYRNQGIRATTILPGETEHADHEQSGPAAPR